MEYLLGSIITLITVSVVNRLFKKYLYQKPTRIPITQSYLHKVMSEIAFYQNSREQRETQSSKFMNRDAVKVMIIEDKAYWIKDNQLYVAHYENGHIDNYSAEKVDTMSMDNVELERTMFIVEKLAEDK